MQQVEMYEFSLSNYGTDAEKRWKWSDKTFLAAIIVKIGSLHQPSIFSKTSPVKFAGNDDLRRFLQPWLR